MACNQRSKDETEVEIPEKTKQKQVNAVLEYQVESQLGEGAFWNYETDELFWVDIEGAKLHIYDPVTKTNRSLPTPSRIGTVVPQTDSTSVVALEDGIYLMNTHSGAIEIISEVEKEMTINRFNDGKCDPNGNLWVGSMHLEQTAPMGSVYKVNVLGETTKMIDSVTISNGLVWTQDTKTFYYIDTPTGTIRAYDYDTTWATITNPRIAVTVPEALGFPDGMAIDAEDKLWVGLWNGNAVARFDPITGALLSKIEVPAHNVTACAFGGPNLDLLYITTASLDMTNSEKEKYPLAGSIFVAKPGVNGVKSTFFATEEAIINSLLGTE